jgi:nucleoside-diphosphate-sugar epimerase
LNGKRVAILGCGYVGMALSRVLEREGAEVVGTTRQTSRLDEIEATGARAILVDAMEPGSLKQVEEWEPHVVFDMIRPQQIGEDRYTTWGTRNIAHAFLRSPLEALIYVSSTSVYGRRSGEWTDEETPELADRRRPSREREPLSGGPPRGGSSDPDLPRSRDLWPGPNAPPAAGVRSISPPERS